MEVNKKILLLTLVHPDFLPPVYAISQVLRDCGYSVHVLTFDSFVPAELDLGENITIESVGRHYDAAAMKRIELRNKFIKRANDLAERGAMAAIAFCPFSFHAGIIVKSKYRIPLVYHALEISDFRMSVFLRSPLSNYRNLRALQTLHEADLLATPSVQRSAWLAGRCHLGYMPHTILNTAYLSTNEAPTNGEQLKDILPASFLNKKIILYTGAVNTDLCTLELVKAFDLLNDEESVLVITGIKDTEYCNDVKTFVDDSRAASRIKLFPYLTRSQMLALQANAHIGVCLNRENQSNIKSKMMAPNKAGEYTSKGLYILGTMSEYMRPLKIQGIASLAVTYSPEDISIAMKDALAAVSDDSYKEKITSFVHDYFSMQQQLKPVIKYLAEVK